MTMTFDGTNGITYPDSSLIAGASGIFSFRNRFMNGGMQVAQRGTSFTANSSASGTTATTAEIGRAHV